MVVFMNLFNEMLEKLTQENKYCHLLGDYNINLLNVDNLTLTAEFAEMVFSMLRI